jgi:hypothetical protein
MFPRPHWRYLFLPEDPADARPDVPASLRACKTLLWIAAAILLGVALGRTC